MLELLKSPMHDSEISCELRVASCERAPAHAHSFGIRTSEGMRKSGIRNCKFGLIVAALSLLWGCAAPFPRLDFPAHALERSSRGWFYDLHQRGRADFALLADEQGKLDLLAYDDDGDGRFDRIDRL